MADNNKDDIEILDFVDNELMEISQEELDKMQSAFDELEASADADDDASGSVDADSMVVQPKSVDTRFSEPVDDVDLDLGEKLMPINQAIKEACEIIYLHTAYK